jgi:c-di-GMP-binding flagellar brake protein YcgR
MSNVTKCLAVVCLCSPVLGQSVDSVVRQLGWSGPTWSALVLLILLFTTIILTFVIFSLRRGRIETTSDKQAGERLFAESAERCKLDGTEIEALTRILRHEASAPPQAVFQSVSLFERCIHAEVEHILQTVTAAEERDEMGEVLATVRKKLGYAILPLEHPLVSTRNLPLGQVGAVFGRSHRTPLLQRVVVMANNEYVFRVQYDPQNEDPVQFAPGNTVKLAFARQNDGFYGITVAVAESDGSGTLVFAHTLELKRNQLRQFVRVEVNAPVRFRLLKTLNPDKSEVPRGQAMEAKIGDVSGGGLSFLHAASLRPGDIVSLSFSLAPHSFSGIGGKVLRVSLQEGKTQTLYRHHVEFTNLEQKYREQIVKYVFERQRQANQWR